MPHRGRILITLFLLRLARFPLLRLSYAKHYFAARRHIRWVRWWALLLHRTGKNRGNLLHKSQYTSGIWCLFSRASETVLSGIEKSAKYHLQFSAPLVSFESWEWVFRFLCEMPAQGENELDSEAETFELCAWCLLKKTGESAGGHCCNGGRPHLFATNPAKK